MLYSGRSYNYLNELIELLHNMEDDWPPECANITFDGMLVNTTGKEAGYTEGNICVEQMNDSIKEKAHGVNASPKQPAQKNINPGTRPRVETQSLVNSKDPYVPLNIPTLQEQWFNRNSDLLGPIPLELPGGGR